MKKSIAIVLMSALALSACHGMKPKHHHGKKIFKHMDANSDGVITKSEFKSAHNKKFEKLDTNNDGKITKDEFKSHKKRKFK